MVGAQAKMKENKKGMDAHWNGLLMGNHTDTAIDGSGFFDPQRVTDRVWVVVFHFF